MHLLLLAAQAKKSFWILDPLYNVLGQLLAWFYAVIPSYGVAIVVLTVAVRLLLFPLTAKQTRSMQAMQKVQPELKRLQAKYKNDRQKLNEEMMKFYKEHQINPFAGCLPLLLQMPLFIVLYRLIISLTGTVILGATVVGGTSTAPQLAQAQVIAPQFHGGTVKGNVVDKSSVSGNVQVGDRVVGKLAGAEVTDGDVHGAKVGDPVKVVDASGATIGTISGLTVQGGKLEARPKHIPKDSSLADALGQRPGKMYSWGFDLARRAGEDHGGFGNGLPFYLLIVIVVLTGYYQQKQMTARLPADAAANPQTQMMGRIFPAFFGVISLTIPAGVVVYFIASNIWQIGQQAWMFRQQDATAGKPTPPRPARTGFSLSSRLRELAQPPAPKPASEAPAADPSADDAGAGEARSEQATSEKPRPPAGAGPRRPNQPGGGGGGNRPRTQPGRRRGKKRRRGR